MIACGDLKECEEYLNPVIFDFLLFCSERVLNLSPSDTFPIDYDDIEMVCHRERGGGIQSEYLLRIKSNSLSQAKQDLLNSVIQILSQDSWNGSTLT